MIDPMIRLKEIIDILLAVEMLEYHDKNWLSYDNKKRNEEKRELLVEAAFILEPIEE